MIMWFQKAVWPLEKYNIIDGSPYLSVYGYQTRTGIIQTLSHIEVLNEYDWKLTLQFEL